LAGTTHSDALYVGMCPNMRPVGVMKKKEKRTETFMCQTGYLPRPPRRHSPRDFACGSYPGDSYIVYVSRKSV